MDRLYIRSLSVVAVAGMFCWLNASVGSAQTATNLKCNWCVGPGEVGWNAVGWAMLVNTFGVIAGLLPRQESS